MLDSERLESERLDGGGVNEVIRVGSTVLRPTGPWTPRVHELLRYLRERGFMAAPEVFGVDGDGLEILSFIPGQVSNYPATPAAASMEALETAADLLRMYHDATVGFAGGGQAGWMLPSLTPAEVICHGDYAPHNCVLDGNRVVGIIDFDTVHPGPRLWDVAYAVYRWVPLTAPGNQDGFGTPEEQAVRMRIFCDRYGLGTDARIGLIDAVSERLNALVDFMRTSAAAGNKAFQGHLDQGHHVQYFGDAAYVQANREVFDRVLLSN